MNLVVDIGNSFTKLGVFNQEGVVKTTSVDQCSRETILDFFSNVDEKVRHVIVSSVREIPEDLNSFFEGCFKNYFILNHKLNLPFKSVYKTPETLGADRIALAAACVELFPNKNCLAIDMGSCITADFIDKDQIYHGGAISPGVNMRLKAMHNFTGRLPLIDSEELNSNINQIGNSTKNSMLSGVYHGVMAELSEMIAHYDDQFNDLQVLLTGGDHTLFEKHLKKPIFANPNLVLIGLNKILTFNLEA